MKPLVRRIFKILEQSARRLFDPESERLSPAVVSPKPSRGPKQDPSK